MSFDADPADERTQMDECIAEIKRLKAQLATSHQAVKDLVDESGGRQAKLAAALTQNSELWAQRTTDIGTISRISGERDALRRIAAFVSSLLSEEEVKETLSAYAIFGALTEAIKAWEEIESGKESRHLKAT